MTFQPPSPKAPDRTDVALGTLIRLRRRIMGMSQEDLASRCEVSYQQIQKYENGVNRVPFSRLVQIAAALGTNVRELVAPFEAVEGMDASEREVLPKPHAAGAAELIDAYGQLAANQQEIILALLRSIPNVLRE